MAQNNSHDTAPRIQALFSEMRDALGDTTTDLIHHFYHNTLTVMKKAVLIAESESPSSPLSHTHVLEIVPNQQIEEIL